jgi:hypothetical protein
VSKVHEYVYVKEYGAAGSLASIEEESVNRERDRPVGFADYE